MSQIFENDLTKERLEELLQTVLGAIADIAVSHDMTIEAIRAKALRIHTMISDEVDSSDDAGRS